MLFKSVVISFLLSVPAFAGDFMLKNGRYLPKQEGPPASRIETTTDGEKLTSLKLTLEQDEDLVLIFGCEANLCQFAENPDIKVDVISETSFMLRAAEKLKVEYTFEK